MYIVIVTKNVFYKYFYTRAFRGYNQVGLRPPPPPFSAHDVEQQTSEEIQAEILLFIGLYWDDKIFPHHYEDF